MYKVKENLLVKCSQQLTVICEYFLKLGPNFCHENIFYSTVFLLTSHNMVIATVVSSEQLKLFKRNTDMHAIISSQNEHMKKK